METVKFVLGALLLLMSIYLVSASAVVGFNESSLTQMQVFFKIIGVNYGQE